MQRLKHSELQSLSEVLLELYSPGSYNDFPARLIGLARRLNKHLERVFAKLGVETRTAAANTALQVLGR